MPAARINLRFTLDPLIPHWAAHKPEQIFVRDRPEENFSSGHPEPEFRT
jgi:hypothetical protein